MCDTFVVLGSQTANGCTIFAKNSDRDPNEAQRIERFAGQQHEAGETVRCTYVEIPQVGRTHTVLGSRPWWMWGFEHGVNEHGLAIGNEALWSRLPASGEPGLLGMDLVRLTLERARDADEALSLLTSLIETYGQSGRTSLIRNKTYQNAFILADHGTAWIVETAGRHWAAKRVSSWASISNVYSIGTDYDRLSVSAIAFATESGWHDPARGPFDFALAYADPTYEKLPTCSARLALSRLRLAGTEERRAFSLEDAFSVLRTHHPDTGSPARTRGAHTLCMHANTLGDSETAASAVVELPDPAEGEPLTFWGSQNSPCLSSFVPLWLDGPVPGAWSTGNDQNDMWWDTEMLQRQIDLDYERYSGIATALLSVVESEAVGSVRALPPQAGRLVREQLMANLTARRRQALTLLASVIGACVAGLAPPADTRNRADLHAELNRERSQLWP